MSGVVVEPLPMGVHPIVACTDAVEAALKDVAGVDPSFMRVTEKAEALRRLSRLEGQVAELRLRLMAASADVAEATADRSVATWLATEMRSDPRALAGDLSLARGLEQRWTRVRDGIAGGTVNVAQAKVIAQALEDLPHHEVDSLVVARAEQALVDYAADYGPRELRRLGRRILEVAAPDECDEQEAKALEREERRAAVITSLSLRRLGDGTTRLAGRIPDAVADRLRTFLDAYTSPRYRGLENDGSPPRRGLAQAFAAFLEGVDPGRMPLHGGDATTVIVTIDHDVLAGRLPGVATMGEELISAGQVRRLACTADIIPAVLGGKSEILDLGRDSRLFKPHQRKAMALRDKRCRTEGCTIPAAWCEAHHAAQPWSRGGRTDLADGILLCSWHHHRAHDDHYRHERLASGDFRFHRRT